jgi:hypothetical protein
VIDFRYHIVSIVAVFLALAVGIVLGSGPLKDDISGFLEARTDQLASQKVELQDEVAALRTEVESSQEYAALVQGNVVDGLLIAQPVALVLLPGVSGDAVDDVESAIDLAGGRVAERIEIRDGWTDPDQRDVLGRLAEDLVRGGETTDAYELAAQALAGAVVTDNDRLIGQPFAPSSEILGAFEELEFVRVEDGPITRSGAAIILGSDDLSEAVTGRLLPLFAALEADAQGAVVSAPITSAEAGGVVAAVRDSDLSDTVSTVDRLDTPQGVTVTVLALVDQRRGIVGHYGSGPGADGPAPDPVPSN